jgi:hypothetical protein
VDDAAEHIGNWSPDVPAWYDWEKHDFLSYWFGTKQVANRPGYAGSIWGEATVTPPTGIYREALYRVAQVALNAWCATGKERYLAWTQDFLDAYIRRLETLGSKEDLVRIFCKEGWPAPDQTDYFTTQGWPYPDNRFVYGRYIPALLTDLYTITHEPRYLEAARTFLDYGFPDVLRFWHQTYYFGSWLRYRLLSGDSRYDTPIFEAIEAECARSGDFDPTQYPFEANGVQALEFARNRGPIAHSVQFWITGEERYAVKALQQAVSMAEALLTRKTEEFIEGFATAHIGGIVDQKMVNTLLNLSGWRPGMQAHNLDILDVLVWEEGGKPGLPEEIALLRWPAPLPTRRITLVNIGTEPRTLRLAAGEKSESQPKSVTLPAQATLAVEL